MSEHAAFADDLHVRIFPFSRQDGGEETVIGRPDTGVFLALPNDAVEILDDLAKGYSIGETRKLYQDRHGENPDLANFLAMLAQQGFVLPGHVVGSEVNNTTEDFAPTGPAVRYHFENIPQWVAELFFGRPALVIYFFVIAVASFAVSQDSSLFPGRSALFFETYHTPKILTVVGLSFVTLFFHEMSHLLAARAVGVSSRLGISNRLWILVAETDMSGLWSVPKRKRYLPILAGPVIDLFSGSILILILAAHRDGLISLSPLVVELLRAVFFAYLIQFVWQLFFFVRTDFYYVLTNLLDCKNLLADTEIFLKNKMSQVFDLLPHWGFLPRWQMTDQTNIPTRERRMIRVYSGFWILGRVAALVLLFTVTLPLTIDYFFKIVSALRAGYVADTAAFIDAIMTIALSLGLYAIGIGLWFKKSRKTWKSNR